MGHLLITLRERGRELDRLINERLLNSARLLARTPVAAVIAITQGLCKCVRAYVHDFQSVGGQPFGENDTRCVDATVPFSPSFLSLLFLFLSFLLVPKLVQSIRSVSTPLLLILHSREFFYRSLLNDK